MRARTHALVHTPYTHSQEKPNDIPEGETPHNVTMYVYEGNVDLCRPGDRVTITGTYRAQVCVWLVHVENNDLVCLRCSLHSCSKANETGCHPALITLQ